jgi:ribonuclease T2
MTDSCCTETYGGLVLATQFWSTYTGLESAGQVLPKDSWTLHGLWPDYCNGSYTQYCDLRYTFHCIVHLVKKGLMANDSRQYDPVPSPNTTTGTPSGQPVPAYKGPSIDTLIEPFGRYDLLAYMNKYLPPNPHWHPKPF